MTSRRLVLSLSLPLVVLLLLALAVPAAGKGKKDKKNKKRFRSADDLVVAFMRDEPLISVVHWREGRQYLTYPSLGPGEHRPSERERRFRSIVEGNEASVRAHLVSPSRKWLAVSYKKGPVTVTDLDTGATVLSIAENVSPVFDFHPVKDLLVLFQPKVGITQWDLERGVRVEPTILGATIGVTYLEVAPNGNFARTAGMCRAGDWTFDYCIFDLRDGSTVAWADELVDDLSQLRVTDEDVARAEDFQDLLEATGFVSDRQRKAARQEQPPGCRRLEEGRLFCCSAASVALTDENAAPAAEAPAASSKKGAMGLLGLTGVAQARPREFPGQYLWQIAANRDRKRLFINSCDLSADGKWVALGVDSSEVLLFSTATLEEASLAMMGSWQQPVLVDSYEFP